MDTAKTIGRDLIILAREIRPNNTLPIAYFSDPLRIERIIEILFSHVETDRHILEMAKIQKRWHKCHGYFKDELL